MAKKETKTGKKLERRVVDAYRAMGAWRKVEHDVDLAGNQIDVYVELETPGHLLHRIAVEAKDRTRPVGVKIINDFAQIVDLLHRAHLIDEGIVVSATGFTRPARKAAETHGIRLLEQADLDVMVAEAKAAGRAQPSTPPVPQPPTPYIAHPYPAQAHFTGREQERADLTAWLSDDTHPLLAVIAIGGMGKSALGWHWFHNDLVPLGLGHWDLRGALWWCFYDRESGFERFLERSIAYVSGGEMDAADWPVRDRMECLRALLAERPYLLMLDGVERLLRAYARMDAPYLGDAEVEAQRDVQPASLYQCADPNVGTFLQWLAGLRATKTLLTSRLLPRELEGLAGVAQVDLTQMDPEDAVRFFRAMEIRGTRAEIQTACEPYGYLPLALRLLAGLVAEDPARPGDIAVATEYEITEDLRGKEQHHILERAYNALNPAARELLSRMAAFRSPVDYIFLEDVFASPFRALQLKGCRAWLFTLVRRHWALFDKGRLKTTLQSLQRRGLLLRQGGTDRYDLHPVVRHYAYNRLADKVWVHTLLRNYFLLAIPKPGEEKVQNVEDLAPVIELYHHTVRVGWYNLAAKLYRDRLAKPLHFRFGAYQIEIELLRALFPDGEDRPPWRMGKAWQAWTLAALANAYSCSDQPRRAVPLYEMHNALWEKAGDKVNLAIGLGDLARGAQLPLGDLAAAERNLRCRIEMNVNESDVAYGHQELGRLLAYQGAFAEAARELDAALSSFSKLGTTQSECVVWSYRALCALLIGDAGAALEAARRARELADVRGYERDIIRAEWLLGAVHRAPGELAQAEPHLGEALRRCRRINLVELEPNILLELARLRHAQGRDEALSLAREALDIADRCQYRLVQADCHNFLAELALALSEVEGLEAGDRQKAHEHAETARERAWCDGPPHRYEAAFQEAERLLERIASDAERARRS